MLPAGFHKVVNNFDEFHWDVIHAPIELGTGEALAMLKFYRDGVLAHEYLHEHCDCVERHYQKLNAPQETT